MARVGACGHEGNYTLAKFSCVIVLTSCMVLFIILI